MRIRYSLALAFGLVVVLSARLHAEEGKEVTLTGTITCAKCDLKVEQKCATVIKVNEDGKDVVYYFDPQGHKDHHKTICMEPHQGTVTGTVSEHDGKKYIKVASVDFK